MPLTPKTSSPARKWAQKFANALPAVHRRTIEKLCRRVKRYGPEYIFTKDTTRSRPLGAVEYGIAMRNTLEAAKASPKITSATKCNTLCKSIRKAYIELHGRPQSPIEQLRQSGTLITKTKSEARKEALQAEPPKAGGGMVNH